MLLVFWHHLAQLVAHANNVMQSSEIPGESVIDIIDIIKTVSVVSVHLICRSAGV